MPYVDLRERRDEEHKGFRGAWRDGVLVPHLLLVAGAVLAVPAIAASYAALASNSTDFWVALLYWVPAALLLFWGARGLPGRSRGRRRGGAGHGAEKSLLMALRDGGGAITAVGAALETPLTVDEAEGILSRLAADGHLHVESHDGTLYYVLPGELPPPGPLGRR